jgi:hypothetical protein
MHSTEYPEFFGFQPDDASERELRLWGEWYEWPFEPPLYDGPGRGCIACAWAHWYNLNDSSMLNPCNGSGARGWENGPNPDCGYGYDFMHWVAGDMHLHNRERAERSGSREQQQTMIEQERRERTGTRPLSGLVIPDEPDWDEPEPEDREWPGCRACLTFVEEGGSEDPCHWAARGRDVNRPNPRCHYLDWYRMNRLSEADPAAIRRRGDYPQMYRSRYGRGECIRRDTENRCPRGCPCRTDYTQDVVHSNRLRNALNVYIDWEDDNSPGRAVARVNGEIDDEMTEHAQYTWDSFPNLVYSRRMQRVYDTTLAALIAREGGTT